MKQYKFKEILKVLLKPNGKQAFIYFLPKKARLLDVGCGNNSPLRTKLLAPSLEYIGLDIGNYNQQTSMYADQYILTEPENFDKTIIELGGNFDALVSSHNLEHCNNREATLNAMISSLKIGGDLYLAFPSESTVFFPKRMNTLNYYDDPTHIGDPPSFDKIIQTLEDKNFEIKFATKKYRPLFLTIIGFLLEPISHFKKKVLPGTWAYWGFESIVVAKKTDLPTFKSTLMK